ncbi:MAG: excinuclease ABC subunit C [Candidatus Azotimanducaceae bacterium]|jgi:excinuclease ABC subunit C
MKKHPKKEVLEPIVQNLPQQPGVYQYFDKTGKIVYVGKAKNLKKRVASYFTESKGHSNKVKRLVAAIVDIQYIVVDTEIDALLLENNLIKKYQPRYNVMLKDDKTYPWICIKKEPFPRVFSTRRMVKDGSEYFGPYANASMKRTMLELVNQLFPLRTCNLKMTPENISKGKFKVCLEYHIGNCLGPCEAHQSEDNYDGMIDAIRLILKGNVREVSKTLKVEMMKASEAMEFEEAQSFKEKLEHLENYQSKSTIVSPTINNVDVYSIVSDPEAAYVNYFKVVSGAIVQSHTLEMKKQLDESDADLLLLAITEFRERFSSESKEIVVPIELDVEWDAVKFHVPQRGDKKQLLDLSLRNVAYYKQEKLKQLRNVDPERHSKRILGQMQEDLRLTEMPVHIECFDNSNIQGTHPVSACVVFRDAKPSKKDYRHFNIKTVEGPDDFASMEEVVYRRYKRMLDEKETLPQLIVIDGGKGQLSASLTSLEKLGLRGKIAIIGIAKRLEEIYFPGDSIPLYLDKRSESLKLIQFMRNEAHRFGITHHRNKRSKAGIKSELEEIEGIGTQSIDTLLKHFKSVKRIKEATLNALEAVVNKKKSRAIWEHYNKSNE